MSKRTINGVEVDIEKKEQLESMSFEYSDALDKDKFMKVDLTGKESYVCAYPMESDGDKGMFLMCKGDFKTFVAPLVETMLLNMDKEQLGYLVTRYIVDLKKISGIDSDEIFDRVLMTGELVKEFCESQFEERIEELKSENEKLKTQVESYEFAIRKLGK